MKRVVFKSTDSVEKLMRAYWEVVSALNGAPVERMYVVSEVLALLNALEGKYVISAKIKRHVSILRNEIIIGSKRKKVKTLERNNVLTLNR